MTDMPNQRSRAALATVRPWHSLASLGLLESDLTPTRHGVRPSADRHSTSADRSRTAPREA
ncbi:hypothetical protein [Streptomyces sp. A5-4]|uniref:hypothetical protein n=1 Tax=Streptomyces sp. A5-4 TaxID=3384771 RepID=UPI003DA9EE07